MTDSVYQDFCEYYDEAFRVWSPFYAEADLDLRFYAGDQWSDEEKERLSQEGRNALVFNRSASTIDMITGYQRQHRTSSVVVGRNREDDLVADLHSQCLLYNETNSNAYPLLSDAFGGGVRSGMNVLTVYKDMRYDQADGDIAITREPYNGIIFDPYTTKRDWSDCAYAMKRRYVNPVIAASFFPDDEKEIMEIAERGAINDEKFQWLPHAQASEDGKVLAITELWRQDWENKPYMIDRVTGNKWDWSEDPELYGEMIRRFPERFFRINRQVQRVRRDIMINDQQLETQYNPFGLNEYPFVPVFGYWLPEINDWSLKIQSVQRRIRDAQREVNMRRCQYLDLVESQINSGFMAEEDSVVNPDSLYQSSQNKVIWTRRGRLGSVVPIHPPQVPPGHFEMADRMDRDLMELAGANDASFGRTETPNESGIMQLIKQSAAIVNLQGLFDGLRDSQKLLAKKLVKLTQTWSPEKIQRITGVEPPEEFFDPDLPKYDIVIQEGVQTDTQRQAYFRQLVELSQMGVPIPPEELAREAPIQGRSKLDKVIEAQAQAAAQEKQKADAIEQQLIESQAILAQSQSIRNMADAEERYTRAGSNQGLQDEREARAVQEEMDAALKQVEAMRKLQGLDLENAQKALEFIKQLQESVALEAEERSDAKETRIQREDEARQQGSEALSAELQSALRVPQGSEAQGPEIAPAPDLGQNLGEE